MKDKIKKCIPEKNEDLLAKVGATLCCLNTKLVGGKIFRWCAPLYTGWVSTTRKSHTTGATESKDIYRIKNNWRRIKRNW